MNTDKLRNIQIDRESRQRPAKSLRAIFATVAVVTLLAVYFAWPKKNDGERMFNPTPSSKKAETATPSPAAAQVPVAAPARETSGAALTVSGYIINRARIEISPRFQGQVSWIGVKKGDRVAKDQIVVTLDDAEQKARLLEAEGRLANANASLEKSGISYERIKRLVATKNETKQDEDDARMQVEIFRAAVKEAQGNYDYAKTQLDWTVIRSPIDGVVLEKLVDPGELVTPISFGSTHGPSTALMAVADPNDLQVEIDVNEADLPKIFPNQKCHISPEAYPDKSYGGFVAEIAPEANRQKGTLQIKVQIENPDRYLTPELSARVDFLK